MPAGSLVIGHEHKTRHFNIILQGSAIVAMDGEVEVVAAPSTFVSGAGVRKVLLVREDMVWQTVHPIGNIDGSSLDADEQARLVHWLEPSLIDKSDAWLEHNKALISSDINGIKEKL